MFFSERVAVRPLLAKALLSTVLGYDKDPLWNEMNRVIKKKGVRLFCGFHLIRFRKTPVICLRISVEKKTRRCGSALSGIKMAGEPAKTTAERRDMKKKQAVLPEKTSTKSPGEGH